jgi:hypothetical protein
LDGPLRDLVDGRLDADLELNGFGACGHIPEAFLDHRLGQTGGDGSSINGHLGAYSDEWCCIGPWSAAT